MLFAVSGAKAQTTNSVGSMTLSASSPLSIPSGTVTLSTGTLSLTADGSDNPSIGVTGAGLLQLASTVNGVSSPDIYFNSTDTDNGTANWGSRVATPVGLGSTQRVIFGKTNHSSVDKYGVNETDCQFNGVISGAGGLTYIAQDSNTGSQPMECPLALNAANTFTGPLQIQRGSVYLGVANAFPAGDVLQFSVASGNNGKFFLYGQNATVANLASTGAGNAVIANGNRNPSPVGPATLTIVENTATTYAGTLINTNVEYANTGGTSVTVLNVVKTGPAALTLTGTNKYTGTLTVNAGKLYLNIPAGSYVGLVTVTNGGTLGGSGLIATNVTVANGSALEAGGGTGSGTLTLKSLVLGNSSADALSLNLSSTAAGIATSFAVTNLNGLTNNGTTTVNISGVLPTANPATYTLLTYSGTVKGSGTFVLGSIPNFQIPLYITNNPSASAIQLVVPLYVPPVLTWVGSPTNDWDLLGNLDWFKAGTTTPAAYTDNSTVVFDDTAANFNVNLASIVQPYAVVFTNLVKNYSVTGTGGISNTASLTLQGTASVTLNAADSYTGNTTVGSGTLVLGNAAAIPSGPSAGSVTVNGTLDLAGYSPALNNLAGTGTVDDLSAGGSPMLTVSNSANSTFSGAVQNTTGSLALTKTGAGTLTLGANNTYAGGTTIAGGAVSIAGANGLGSGAVNVTANLAGGTAGFLTVATSAAVNLTNNLTLPNASGTYVLTKNATGQLTLSGSLSGGGTATVLRTTTDTTGDKSTIFEFAGPNSYAGGIQLYRGIVQVDNPNALGTGTIYGDANASTLGDLNFTNSMIFANPLVLQSATSLSPNNYNVTLTGGISGSGALTKYGTGTLSLGGALAYSGTTTATAGTLNLLNTFNTYQNQPLNIAAGAVVNSFGLLNIDVNENGSIASVNVLGAGSLNLASTNSSATNADIYFGPDHSGTSFWGAAIATPINLGASQRFIFGKTGHNGVGQYGFTNSDAQFRGTISGTGGLTIIAQMTWTASTPAMEVPFVLMASNSFSGPLEIQRGSVYLGNANALTQTNVLFLNPATGNNARFFLYGTNATVGSLSSATNGTSIIANGNEKTSAALTLPTATLTVWQTTNGTFAGSLQDTQSEYDGSGTGTTGPLNLSKYGPAALTLSGNNSFTGTLLVNQGTLLVNGTSTGGGLVTVNSGAALGGSGTINSAILVQNGAVLDAGNATGFGTLNVNNLSLGASGSDVITLNCMTYPGGMAGNVNVVNVNGFTNNASVTLNVNGITPTSPGSYNLVTYAGSLQGAGTFAAGTLPANCTAYITNNTTASAIQLVVTSVTLPEVTWAGSPLNYWDLLGSNVWVFTTNGLPASYQDGDVVTLDDTASNFLVNLTATVAPAYVVVTNNVNNYVLMGTGGITGYASLTKTGAGTLTLLTTNNYSGATTIAQGILSQGAAGVIPGGAGAGNVTVNGTLDLGGFSLALNGLTGAGVVDNLSAGGTPVLVESNNLPAVFLGTIQNASGTVELDKLGSGTLTLGGNNTYGGVTAIDGGALQVGNGGTAGTLGAGTVLDMGIIAFNRTDSNTVPNDITGTGSLQQNGTGTIKLNGNLTYTGPTLVNAGTLIFPHNVTFDAGAGASLTVASNAVAETGFEIFLNANPNGVAVDIAGAGTTRLISTLNRIESYADMVIGANNNGVSTANYGIRIASGLDLGATERLFWAYSSRDDVATYGLNGCDCQFAGPISGSAQLQLLGENSWPGVNTMEEQFALNASNSFTGPLEVLRGSVYLGNPNALVNGNVLILDPAASANSQLFLYGYNASIADLQSGGYGSIVIADGNNVSSTNVGPATLTVTENHATTFAGNIMDWYTEYTAPPTGLLTPTLSLVKNGPAALTLSGTNSYSGTTVINAGKLYVNKVLNGGGALTVNTNATLGGSGIINSTVTVQNGGAIEGGTGAAVGNLQIKSLNLGVNAGDDSILNLAATASLNVTNNNGLVLNGGTASVTVNVGGVITSVGAVPLITYKGTVGGAGFAGFQLGSLPAGILGYLSNDTANASIDFVATLVTTPRWTGALSSEWSANTLAAPKNWVLDSDGSTAIDYLDGENVKFDDTAASPTVNLSVANVSPASVIISNVVQTYNIGGAFGITGPGALIKLGTGTATLASANSYSGNTTISAGTLALGSALAIPGGTGAGNVTVNGTLDVAGFNSSINGLSGSGMVDNVTAGGSPTLTVNEAGSSVFAGVVRNTSGSLGLTLAGTGMLTLNNSNTYSGPTTVNGGTLVVNGSLGATALNVQSGAALGGSGVINGTATLNAGAALDLTASSPLSAHTVRLQGIVTVNVSGAISTNNSGTYVLLNYNSINSTNLFQLGPVAGIFNSGYTASLNATSNQLSLVIAPTQPTGTIADVRHVVIFMQENRSFDHYFGSLHGVHGFSDHVTLALPNGNSDLYQPSGSSYELPFHTSIQCLSDLDHSWSATHQAWDSGKWDQWIAAKGTETMAFYNRSDLPYYYSLADNYTICDEYHCSVMSSTDPNRVSFMTGSIDPGDLGGGPLIDNTEPANGWGTNWVTYAELLQKAGVTWKVFQASDNYDDNALYWFAAFKNAAAGTPLAVNGTTFATSVASGTGFLADYTNLITEFRTAVSNNTLPSVSWIIGPDVGSEHPSWSPEDGEILTKGLLDALASNPKVYNSTVFILNYDENDGFYDHGLPINPPTGTTNEFVSGLPIGLGVRVPCIVVSPWSRGGYVCSQIFDHTSVIRFLEKWTGVLEPNISAWRRQVCGDLTSALDFAHPNTNYPTLSLATQNDCSSGTTATPPGQQTVPVQEAGTLLQRPLPYQPNALAVLNPVNGNCNIVMTNSGSASMHFSIYANAYSSVSPTPYDVSPSNSITGSFSTTSGAGNYDFSCYGPNGFLRRFAGNVTNDSGQVDSLAYLNPFNAGFKITLANPGGAPVTFSVTNGWFTNSLATYTVPAGATNILFLDASTNNGWYDLTVTASSDALFVRRFAGHIEAATSPAGLVSSENPSGYKDNVLFTANFSGYNTPTGTAQFLTNGVALGTPVTLSNGVASIATASLPRTNNAISVVYSGDALNPSVTNNLTQVVLNHPPVPATVVYQRAAGRPLAILISDLLTHVTDVDGDAISLVGVGTDGQDLMSTNGVMLSTNQSYITYTNSVTPNVNDSFEYAVSDGQGGVSLGTVLVVVNTNYVPPINMPLILSTTNATVSFFGVPGAQYEIDRCTNLTPGVGLGWVPISTNIAPYSGIIQINDAFQDLGIQNPPTPASAYYRLRPNP